MSRPYATKHNDLMGAQGVGYILCSIEPSVILWLVEQCHIQVKNQHFLRWSLLYIHPFSQCIIEMKFPMLPFLFPIPNRLICTYQNFPQIESFTKSLSLSQNWHRNKHIPPIYSRRAVTFLESGYNNHSYINHKWPVIL